MKIFYYLGDKLKVDKNKYEFECTYAWSVLGRLFGYSFVFMLLIAGFVGVGYMIFGSINSTPTYIYYTFVFFLLFEDFFHVFETLYKIQDFVLTFIFKRIKSFVNSVDNGTKFCLNRFCKRIQK